MKSSEPSFPSLLQRFFTQRLMQQKKVSTHTICSYRDTFRLLLRFAQVRLHTPPDRLAFEQIDAPLVTAFLHELETTRGISPQTRNLRLTAIRSFFRFVAYELPTHSAQIERILATPTKRFTRRLIHFLTRPEVDALLKAPDRSTWNGQRDYALLLLTIQTGMRLSEMTGLTRQNVHFGVGSHVQILGKGRKERVIPLCKSGAAVLKAWLNRPHKETGDWVFPSARGGRLSADAVQHLLNKYLAVARKTCPSLQEKPITFHGLRHYFSRPAMSRTLGQTL